MKKTALLILFLTLGSKIVGFFRDLILSYAYGASTISDAYLIAYTIPGVIFAFIGTGIATSYIPMYSYILKNASEKEANLFTNNITNLLFIFCMIIVFIGFIFTYPLVKIFAAGFDYETMNIAVRFTRISIFGIFLSVIIHVFSAFLNVKNNYHIPVLAGIPFNIAIAVSILLSLKFGLTLLPLGILVALLFQLVFMISSIKKNGFRYELYFSLKDNNIKKIIYLSLPVILGVSVNQINVIVDRTIASTLIVGGISALNYANRLNSFIQGIFVMSIATVMYPLISKMVTDKDIGGLKRTLTKSIFGINIVIVPITVGSVIFSSPLVNLIFGRGAFDEQANILTSSALLFYSIGMLGFGLREILSRVFYSMQDTKTPMINAAIGMIINILLNLILSRLLGISGLALATSVAAIVTTLLLFMNLRKKIGPFGIKQMTISFLKILFASLAMGGVAKMSFNYLTASLSQNNALLVAIGVGAISYFAIIYFMKIEDVDIIVQFIKKKIGKEYL